jgi:serine/threonine protein kinase
MALLNNRYRILQTLGNGGCGETFLAEDTHMPSLRKCVIKQLKPATRNPASYSIIKQRFEREAAILESSSKLTAQIPTLQAYFTEDQEFYLVQDWIDGSNLETLVGVKGPASEVDVRTFLASILRVLDVIHGVGIIHRDLKPANIMLRQSDKLPMLIDFGAVKEIVSTTINPDGSPATTTVVIGSPAFMPPEQNLGHPVFSSDLYALGLTAIFMLTGKMPSEWRLMGTPLNAWQVFAPQVSSQLAEVLNKAIQPNAEDRFRTAKAMLQALELRDTMAVQPPIKPDRTETAKGPGRMVWAFVIVLVNVMVLVIMFAALFGYFSAEERKIEQDAQRRIDKADGQIANMDSLRQAAEEGNKAKQAIADGKIYRLVQIKNSTNETVKYKVLNENGEWWEGTVDAGQINQHYRQNQAVTIKFDRTPHDSGTDWKTYVMYGTAILGREPTKTETMSADTYYFDKTPTNGIDLYHQK